MWPTSGWMMSAACDSKSSRNSIRSWMRSPVAIGMSTFSATLDSALRFSGGTGSSSQAGLNGAISRAIRTAVDGLNRPCISSISSVSGPMASRTASMRDTA